MQKISVNWNSSNVNCTYTHNVFHTHNANSISQSSLAIELCQRLEESRSCQVHILILSSSGYASRLVLPFPLSSCLFIRQLFIISDETSAVWLMSNFFFWWRTYEQFARCLVHVVANKWVMGKPARFFSGRFVWWGRI